MVKPRNNEKPTKTPEMMGERPDLPTEWEDMWDEDEPLECGIENPETCEACS